MPKKRSTPRSTDHGLGLLLDYDGRIMYLDGGYSTATDKGRPYAFSDAATLVKDFFDACERYLESKGMALQGTGDDSPRSGADT